MDPLTALLEGPRAHGAFLLRSVLRPPWSLRIEDEAPLTVLAVVRGDAWLVPDNPDNPANADAVRLDAGDVAVIRGPEPYLVADNPGTPPQAVIRAGQECVAPDGGHLTDLTEFGVRTWGADADGPTVLLTGTYPTVGEVSRRLLAAVPNVVTARAGTAPNPLVAMLADEIERDVPGQEAVLDRVLDLLLVRVLREWLDRPAAPAWYRAHGDPVAGQALRLLQDRPEHPWTVASLASATGVSRAALARRFTDAVGEPPMTYLAAWRLALAADLLRQHPEATLAAIARQVGYRSPFTLSAAFKREYGRSPQHYRLREPA